MRGIADQRQSMGGKLTGIAAGQRENFTFTCQLAEAKAIIERDIQRRLKVVSSACCIRCASPATATRRSSTGADR